MHRCAVEINLVPAQVDKLGHPQAVPIGRQDHGGVAVTVAIALGRFHQALDLGLGKVLTGAQLGIGEAACETVRFWVSGVTSLRCDFIGVFLLLAYQLLS